MGTLQNKPDVMIVFERTVLTGPVNLMHRTPLCSFWKNLSDHFARFACNHSDCYAFRRIEQTDSQRFPQNSAFP